MPGSVSFEITFSGQKMTNTASIVSTCLKSEILGFEVPGNIKDRPSKLCIHLFCSIKFVVIDPVVVFIIWWTIDMLCFCHPNLRKICHMDFFLNGSLFLFLPLVWYINNKGCFFWVICCPKLDAKEVLDNKHLEEFKVVF